MVIFLNFKTISSHLHPLQVENCSSNSRLVVDEDEYCKFRIERVKKKNLIFSPGKFNPLTLKHFCIQTMQTDLKKSYLALSASFKYRSMLWVYGHLTSFILSVWGVNSPKNCKIITVCYAFFLQTIYWVHTPFILFYCRKTRKHGPFVKLSAQKIDALKKIKRKSATELDMIIKIKFVPSYYCCAKPKGSICLLSK